MTFPVVECRWLRRIRIQALGRFLLHQIVLILHGLLEVAREVSRPLGRRLGVLVIQVLEGGHVIHVAAVVVRGMPLQVYFKGEVRVIFG